MGALRNALGRTLRRSALAAALATALGASVLAAQPDAMYEPADFSTLFTDHPGTTQVTQLEQTVALMLDKSRGLATGAEMVSNGDFSAALSGWTFTNCTGQIVNGQLVLTATATATVTATCTTSGQPLQTPYIGGLDVAANPNNRSITMYLRGVNTGSSATVGTRKGRTFSSNTNELVALQWAATSGDTVTIDNVTCKTLPGYHVGMTTAGARATVSARVNMLECSDLHSGVVVGTIGSGGVLPTGFAWSTIAGITKQVLGFGTLSDGRKYVDLRCSGTNGTGSIAFQDLYFTDGNPLLTAVVGSQYTGALTVQYTAGSVSTGFSNANRNLFVAEFNAGSFLNSTQIATASATGAPTRFAVSRTFNQATVTNARMALDLSIAIGGTIDLTFRVIEPQLEYGTVASRFQRVTTSTDYDSAGFPVYLRGDGVDDGIFNPYLTGVTFPFTMICAAKAALPQLGGVFGLWGGAPPYYEIQKTTTANQWRSFDRGAVNYSNTETTGQASAHVLTMETTATTTNLIIDGVDGSAATTQDNVIGTLTDIRIFNGGGGFFGGMFYGGLLFLGTRTASQIAVGQLWCAQKSTIT